MTAEAADAAKPRPGTPLAPHGPVAADPEPRLRGVTRCQVPAASAQLTRKRNRAPVLPVGRVARIRRLLSSPVTADRFRLVPLRAANVGAVDHTPAGWKRRVVAGGADHGLDGADDDGWLAAV
jgi:hypothetical protein